MNRFKSHFLKYNRRICFFVLILLNFGNAFSQKYYLFQHYNTSNGLANNNVMTLNQDKNGYMYFGTDAGLSRFDGFKFNNNVIPIISRNTAFVECIDRNSEGNIAVSSFMHGIFVQQSDGTFKQYLIEKFKVGKNVAKALKVISKNKILVSTGTSLYLFENGSFKTILFDKDNKIIASTMEYDHKGNIWFGGYHGLGVIQSADTSHIPWYFPELKDLYINKILFDEEGNLLIGSIKGYYKLVFNVRGDYTKGYKVLQPLKVLESAYINNIYIDNVNNLWIATSASGVYKINKDTISENISIENGLPAVGVMRTFQDNEGNYWFANNSGVSKLSGFNKYFLSFEGKQLKEAGNIKKDAFGRYFLSNESCFFIMQNNNVSRFDIKGTAVGAGGIKRFIIDKNTLWVSNYNGLYSLELNKINPDFRNFKKRADFKKYDVSRVRCLTNDKEGNIWIASDKGVYLFCDNKFITCQINHKLASKIRPVKILNDKYGYYWFGDFSNGLYRMKLTKIEDNKAILDSVQVYKSLKPDSSFVTAWVQDMLVDSKGCLWYSTLYTGVYKLQIDKNGVKNYELFSTKNGLSNNQVTHLYEDKDNNIWFSTLEGADCYNSRTGKFTHFNKKNTPGSQIYCVMAEDNKVFLEFEEGILIIEDLNKEKLSNIIPKPIISNVYVNGIIDSIALSGTEVVKFRHNQNYLTFEYGAITFKTENNILYQYKLEGLNDNWGSFTENHNISFSNLAPGNYRFMVRTKNSDGLVNKEYASFAFHISPPFYRTWWFILMISISVLSFIYTAYKYRIKQLLKVERLRTRIASDLHDDIGSTLSSISILSEILSNQLDNSPKSSTMISQIGTNARNMLESMDDIIWAVNPSNDKFQNLGLRVREYAIPLFESKNIKFNIHIDSSLAMLQLPMDIRRNLYLIAKESINNLVKYSECSEVKVEFSEHNPNLLMTVEDNGKGFDPESPTTRNGLKNMKRRASQIHAQIDISSNIGKGSIVKLIVKII
jgi:signal transduction histidine kinase/ligand-binding sensor domain-containing protein